MFDMKYIIFNLLTIVFISLLTCVSCYDDGTDYISDEVRISLYPEPAVFNADGTTDDGDDNYSAVVTVNRGSSVSKESWTAEIMDSPEWAAVETAKIYSSYNDLRGNSQVYDITEDGIKVSVEKNTGAKRSLVLRVTLKSRIYKDYTFKQESNE